MLAGVGEAIRQFNKDGWKVFVVTNQGGIGLGYMRESALEEIHKKMKNDLSTYGAAIDDIAYCPHQPHANCPCRKPKAQLILDLAKKHAIDLGKSYMIGDREPDIIAGKNAGTTTVLIGERDKEKVRADRYFPDLLAFSNWLINE